MPFRRSYICCACGAIKRANANYLSASAHAPACCGNSMELLSYEQTIAATRLACTKRAQWMQSGGKVVKCDGKRRWKATD